MSYRKIPSKKRKIDDADEATYGAACDDIIINAGNNNDGGGDIQLPPQRDDLNIMAKLDRMEQLMLTLVEKQATVSSLESRCEQLEKKCSALENKLESSSQSLKDHIDRKLDSMHINLVNECSQGEKRLKGEVDSLKTRAEQYHQYNSMLVKYQSWQYSATICKQSHWLSRGYTNDEAAHLVKAAKMLKDMTTKLRRGELPHDSDFEDCSKGKGINMNLFPGDVYTQLSCVELLPHWKEFAAALAQCKPIIDLLPDEYDNFFVWGSYNLSDHIMMMIKDALIGKPFAVTNFIRDVEDDSGWIVEHILAVAESNQQLQCLSMSHNIIRSEHIDRICSFVHNHAALEELDIFNSSFEETGIGNSLLRAFITSGELKLSVLSMCFNGISSDVSTSLADFIASNPMLEELNLLGNELNDSDAEVLANALRTNSTLQCLQLKGNSDITESGMFLLRSALFNTSSLNAVTDSNHCCHLPELNEELRSLNRSDVMKINRGRKIYALLSQRNKGEAESNVQHFADIDVKILPYMLASVQRYAQTVMEDEEDFVLPKVGSLSIVYEVMRKWEKVFNLYELC